MTEEICDSVSKVSHWIAQPKLRKGRLTPPDIVIDVSVMRPVRREES